MTLAALLAAVRRRLRLAWALATVELVALGRAAWTLAALLAAVRRRLRLAWALATVELVAPGRAA